MIVIADDITGAAEIAGMAGDDTIVIATDTRSLSEEDAAAETERIVSKHNLSKESLFFKKTDSALRGNIVAELSVLMQELGYSKCLLLPQNPSKGRIIRDGKYYINNVLLHETSFKFDPEYPATTSVVNDILRGVTYLPLHSPMQEGINIAEATCAEDIAVQLTKTDDDTLLAGAADLFRVICPHEKPQSSPLPPKVETNTHLPLLIICGSTQSNSLANEPELQRLSATEISMESSVFHGRAPIGSWIEQLKEAYISSRALIMTIGHESEGGKEYAIRLRNSMAAATVELCKLAKPKTLIIEGGATAFATLSALGWTQFEMQHEFAPGVVALSHDDTSVILKPGSYPWGGIFASQSDAR